MHGCLLPCPLVTCLPSAVPVVGSGVSVVSPGSCFVLFVSRVACSACGLVLVLLSRRFWLLFLVGHLCFNHRSQRRPWQVCTRVFLRINLTKTIPRRFFLWRNIASAVHHCCQRRALHVFTGTLEVQSTTVSTQSVECVHCHIAGAEHHCCQRRALNVFPVASQVQSTTVVNAER